MRHQILFHGGNMRKLFVLVLVTLSLILCVSCAKPTHQVYFKVTGVSNNTSITYNIRNSGLLGQITDSSTVTVTSLPWTSDTIKATQGQIATMDITIDDYITASPSVTMEIYSDGTKVKSATCTGEYSTATGQITL
jgi:hypothetical protein